MILYIYPSKKYFRKDHAEREITCMSIIDNNGERYKKKYFKIGSVYDIISRFISTYN